MAKEQALELRGKHNFLWKCKDANCGNIQKTGNQCEKCKQFSLGFEKVDVVLPEDAPSKNYEVMDNISYEGRLIIKGTIINLADADNGTISLLKRKLIKVKRDK